MKKIYQKIWELARPYYEKGRPMDIGHIEWMMKEALKVSKKEKLDETILLPLVILHDVGYSLVEKGDYFHKNLREAHMKEGAKLAKQILDKLNYPKDKAEKIVYFISVHDNWAFDDNKLYFDNPELGAFNDLDYIWTVDKKGFEDVAKILNINSEKMLEWVRNNDKPIKRPFFTKSTKKLYETYFKEREKEIRNS